MIKLPFGIGKTHDESIQFIRSNKKKLCDIFASDEVCPNSDDPFSLFMAGSPGAGKTEYSKTYLEKSGFEAVRIDLDEIRKVIPMYNGKNSNDVQAAACIGMDRLYDFVLAKHKSVIMDATFTPYSIAEQNIKRSVRRGRYVEIIYIFQDPILAWEYTKKREQLEGRLVPKEVFVETLFESRNNVKEIKKKFGKSVNITFVMNNFANGNVETYFNINEIDKRTEIPYSKGELLGILE